MTGNTPWKWILLFAFLGGCNRSPAPASPGDSAGDAQRLQVLLEQNIRLTEELLEAREEVATWKIRAALCEPEQSKSTRTEEPAENAPSPSLTAEVQGAKAPPVPPCQIHIQVEAPGAAPLRSRIKHRGQSAVSADRSRRGACRAPWGHGDSLLCRWLGPAWPSQLGCGVRVSRDGRLRSRIYPLSFILTAITEYRSDIY